MEYASGCSLSHLSKLYPDRKFEENNQTKWIFKELCEGV